MTLRDVLDSAKARARRIGMCSRAGEWAKRLASGNGPADA